MQVSKKIQNLKVIYTEVKPKTQKVMTKTKVKVWIDENDMAIPYSRVTKQERLRERHSKKIKKQALDINRRLKDFKILVKLLSDEVFTAAMAQYIVEKKHKGNFTWFNFDRSIKIEINVNEPILFDDLTITAAKQKFDEFLDANITASNEFVKELILDAFSTSKGSLDTKRVLGLAKYKEKVNKPLFSEAVDLIMSAVRHAKSKTYFRVWLKDEEGKYQNIDLNLSSI